MTQTQDADIAGYEQPPAKVAERTPPRPLALSVAALLTAAAVIVAASYLPSPLRGWLVALGIVGVPTFLYERLIRRYVPEVARCTTAGLALVVVLSLTGLLQLGALALHVPVTRWSTVLLTAVMVLPTARIIRGLEVRRPSAPGKGVATARAVELLGLVAGLAVVSLSMARARDSGDAAAVYAIFWAGMGLAFVTPAVVLCVRRSRSVGFELTALAAAGFLAVFARSPWAPNLLDEMSHWGEAEQMLIANRLFEPDSVVTMGPRYPTLETLTVGLVRLGGWSTISVAHLLVLLFHIATLTAVFTIASRWGRRVGGVAAAFYAVSPSFILIDSLYSYESFAIPLAFWFLAVLFFATTESGTLRSRLATRLLLPVLGLTLVTTHHLTTFLLVVVLVVYAGMLGLFRRRLGGTRKPGSAIGVTAISVVSLLAGALLWAWIVQAPLLTYLGIFPRSAITGIDRLLNDTAVDTSQAVTRTSGPYGNSRTLFAGSTLPGYERAAAFVAPFLLAVVCLLSVLRNVRRLDPAMAALTLLAFGYFASLPLTVISGASEGAHRSWATTFLGVAVVVGLATARRQPGRGAPARHTSIDAAGAATRTRRGSTSTAALLLLLVVTLVASFATSNNPYQRFPGRFVLGADGRTVTPDVIRAAEWFGANVGRGERVLSSRRTMQVFGAYAHAQTISYPTWTLFYPEQPLPELIRRQVTDAGVQYVIVDRRLSTNVPIESFFSSNEPLPPSYPLPAASIEKFSSTTWLQAIHSDTNITIFKVVPAV